MDNIIIVSYNVYYYLVIESKTYFMKEIGSQYPPIEETNYIFQGRNDQPLRDAIESVCASAPSWIDSQESLRLREVMNNDDDLVKADEARKKLVSWCFPTLLQALDPLWGGRFGISDGELFTFGLETVDRLVRNWNGKYVLKNCISKGGLRSRLETYICKQNDLPGVEENLPVIETFWSCVKDFYQENSRFPYVEEAEAVVEEKNERENLGLKLIGFGGVSKVFSVHQQFIGMSIAEAGEREERFPDTRENAFRKILYDELDGVVDSLKPKERQAILLWMEADTKTASQLMGYSQEWTRKLIDRSLRKLSHPYRSKRLRDWREEY